MALVVALRCVAVCGMAWRRVGLVWHAIGQDGWGGVGFGWDGSGLDGTG